MQTTLLGFAIGIILALLAALVGPLFIDWDRNRAQFEREAGRLVGLPVRVGGAIEVSLLPTPSIELQKVEIGRAGEDAMRVRALGIEFSLGSLVRGQVRATQMRVVAPELIVSVDREGRAALPAGALGFDPDALSVERLNVEDARLVLLHAATQERLVLEKLWFRGEMRSLAGSFRGEGAFVSRRDLYGYRIAASRQDRGTRLRFSLDPSERTLAAEGEGTVTMDGGMPKFEGALTLIRPVGIARAAGKTVIDDPWRVSARVKADAASASFEQIEFQYGSEERALKLSGNAALKSDERLRLEGALSANQLDLDRLVAPPGQSRPQPVATLRGFVEKFAGALRPPFPVRLALNVDLLTVGGAPLQGLKGEIRAESGGWDLDGFEVRAPGLTQVRLGGRVELSSSGIAFKGPAALSAADPRQLLAWLEGREDVSANGAARPLRAEGEIVLGNETVAIERFSAEIDRKTVAGRLAYRWPRDAHKARLDAELNAAEIDIDSLIGASKNVLDGARFDRPGEISLALDIGRAKIAGVDAQRTTAKLTFDADGLNVERLSFGDFGGVSLDGSGRIDMTAQSPRGSLVANLDARDMAGMAALLDRFAPAGFRGARHVIGRLGATRMRATLDVAEAADKGKLAARLAVQGHSGNTRIAMNANATGALDNLAQAQLSFAGSLEGGADGALWRLVGLEQAVAPAPGAARITVEAEGPLDSELRFESRITSDLLDAGGKGNLRLGEGGRTRFDLAVTRADLRKLAKFSGLADNLARASFASHVAYEGTALSLADIAGNIAGSPLRGSLTLELGPPLRVSGNLEAGSADAITLIAAATGAPPRVASAEGWASEPFTGGLFADMTGSVGVKAGEIGVAPSVSIKDASAALKFSPSRILVENVSGTLAGGKLNGELSLDRAADGVAIKARFALADVDATLAILPRLRPVAGRLGIQLELEGAGRSPKALIGSLAGAGTLSLDRAQLRGLDPSVFAALVRDADRGMPLDATKIHAATVMALDAGRLELGSLEATLAIAGGQARLSTVTARAQGADLAMSGSLDLADLYLDARLVLARAGESSPIGRPEITVTLKGDAASPQRTIDSSAFAGWLALRAVEQQSKKLEAIEGGRVMPRETTQSVSPPQAASPDQPMRENIVLPRPRPAVISPQLPRAQERAAPLPPAINISPLPGTRKPAQVPPLRMDSPPG